MAKKAPKIFKVVKKVVDEKEQLVVRYKNLSKQDAKDFKKDLNDFCQAYLEKIVSSE